MLDDDDTAACLGSTAAEGRTKALTAHDQPASQPRSHRAPLRAHWQSECPNRRQPRATPSPAARWRTRDAMPPQQRPEAKGRNETDEKGGFGHGSVALALALLPAPWPGLAHGPLAQRAAAVRPCPDMWDLGFGLARRLHSTTTAAAHTSPVLDRETLITGPGLVPDLDERQPGRGGFWPTNAPTVARREATAGPRRWSSLGLLGLLGLPGLLFFSSPFPFPRRPLCGSQSSRLWLPREPSSRQVSRGNKRHLAQAPARRGEAKEGGARRTKPSRAATTQRGRAGDDNLDVCRRW
ncbi:hypothetical protein PCL_08531 [Purpureocillium lilacinum]|uniref:Uncharacterized protein n=1 Tax=Purpureocillium lilacinum TaxID=33203 RepID=A0A2U3DRD5_PURLI|nr:hypothetical protein PCL_08531 [Purpureocillium lilacinum]